MEFIKNIEEKEYIEFAQKHQAHFMQTWAWGMVNKESRNLTPCFVGLKDKNKLIAATLLLKKQVPFNMAYFYAPRGFIMDMKNESLLKEFTKKLKEYLKDENGIYLKVDPDVKYHDIDEEGQKLFNGENNYKLFNNFIELGYVHKGFNKLFERNQPRYTFRINLAGSLNNIESKMSKTFLRTIRRSYNYDLKIRESNDIETFYNLVKINANKDGFSAYSLEYYKTLYQIFNKYNQIKVFEAVLNPQELVEKFNKELDDLEESLKNNTVENITDTKNVINRLKNDILLLGEFKEKSVVVCSLICVYSTKGAWALYIGNDTLGTKVNAINRLLDEIIKDAHRNNYAFMDLFGTVGDPHTNYKNLAGVHEFKRKIGGEYIEFIGEFDLVNKKIWYIILPIMLKLYRKVRKMI